MAQTKINYKVVVIGGSAGCLDTVLKIIGGAGFDSNIFYIVIIHRKNDVDSVLSNLINGATDLKVKEVEDKDEIQTGCIYIAPGDYHLLLENEHFFSLDSSEKICYSRPSIDVTFESVSEVFGEAAIGILLSGANADGAEGLKKIKQAGGYTIVQDPETAEVDYMPKQAILLMHPDAVVDGNNIASFLKNMLP